MAKTLSSKDLKALLKGLEAQGWTIKSTKDGYRLYPPEGKILTLHLTLSDGRGMKNLRSEVIKGGRYTWPLD